METDPDRWIDALRRSHDDLVAATTGLSADDIRRTSGSTEWTVAQVLSHLGSGAEINLANLEANLAGEEPPPNEANHPIWDRWNAMTPEAQAAEWVVRDAALVARWEAIDAETRRTQQITLPFLPAPIGLAEAAGFRLSEHALHVWDVRVAFADDATVAPYAVDLLLDRVGFMIGWVGRADGWTGEPTTVAVTTTDPDRRWWLELGGESVRALETEPDPSAPPVETTLALPAEAWLRLAYGRLRPANTPTSVAIDGRVTLDDLRAVLPGF